MRKIIRVDGTVIELSTPHSITKIRELIGADTLDTVLLKDRVHVMLVDDSGHDKNLPINEKGMLYFPYPKV